MREEKSPCTLKQRKPESSANHFQENEPAGPEQQRKKNNLLVKTPCENKLHSLMFAYDMVVGFNSRRFIVYLNERESVTITEKNGWMQILYLPKKK